jgi:biofilm PGA synthesis N-glycosyltransferase PgaC
MLSYALITPARNEEAFIELTIQSVVAQTLRPTRWVIVSDGSTDRTDEIVTKYAQEHEWIELVRMPQRAERHFGGKVMCFNAGLKRLAHLEHQVIGNLDGDLSFECDLFQYLIKKLEDNPRLGVVGAPFVEGKKTYDFRYSSVEHVSGACQLFRRECFEAIGGYTPMKGGGIDVVAVLTARMKGWQTRTFPENVCVHHRGMGTASQGAIAARVKLGQKDYMLGRHFLWQFFRSIYQMSRRPFVIGGLALAWGYVFAFLRKNERPVPKELVEFQRLEQMKRLRSFCGKCLPFLSKRTKQDQSSVFKAAQ